VHIYGSIQKRGLPNFRDGTGRFQKIRVPNFWDAGTMMEVPTCLKYGITENLTCLNSGITENLTYQNSGIKLFKFCSSYPGSSVQCTVHIPCDCTGGEGHVKCGAAGGGAAARSVCARSVKIWLKCTCDAMEKPKPYSTHYYDLYQPVCFGQTTNMK